MTVNNLQVAILTLCVSALNACTTMSGSSSDGKARKQDMFSASERANVTVQRTDHENPILTEVGRERWLQLRKGATKDSDRVMATLGMKEYDVAIVEARAILRNHPGDPTALTVLATALAMQKNYGLAAYYANILSKIYPGQSDVQNLRGLAALYTPHATSKDYERAIASFEDSFNASPTAVAAGLNLGHLYLEIGNAEKAAGIFTKTLARCGNCPEAAMGMGISAMRIGRYSDARAAFTGILDQSPNDAEALYRLALVEKNGYNDNKKASSYLNQLLAKASDSENEVKRRANFMLRRIQAGEHQAPVSASVKESEGDATPELMDASFDAESLQLD